MPTREKVVLSHDDLCHLGRSFQTDYRSSQDQRINEWLMGLIAQARGETCVRVEPTNAERALQAILDLTMDGLDGYHPEDVLETVQNIARRGIA